jgi:peptidyl-prolyl cis-trans isomerase SurA
MRLIFTVAMFTGLLGGAVVIDRISVVVNRHVIKASDIEHDIRVTAYLNREQPKFDEASKKAAAERLITQEIIRAEITAGGYRRAGREEVDNLMASVRQDRPVAELAKYGLTAEGLRSHLEWQMTVIRFIDERFRAGVMVSDEDVRRYYDEHRPTYPGTFEKESAGIRKTLEGEQVNQQFEAWLDGARNRGSIQYREDAFR